MASQSPLPPQKRDGPSPLIVKMIVRFLRNDDLWLLLSCIAVWPKDVSFLYDIPYFNGINRYMLLLHLIDGGEIHS